MNIYHQIIIFAIGIALLLILIQYWPAYSIPYPKPTTQKINHKDSAIEHFTSPVVEPSTQAWSPIYAKLYEKVFSNEDYYKNESDLIKHVLQQHNQGEWTRGIDLGTGTGRHYKEFASQGPLLGIDNSKAMIEIAQTRNPEGDFMVGDFRQSGLIPPQSVDVVFCLGETLYLNAGSEQHTALQEINKWMKPNGILVIHFWNIHDLDPAPQPYSQILENKHAVTYFENLQHEAWFEPRKEIGPGVFDYEEKYIIELDNGDVKKNDEVHRVFLPPDRKVMMELLNSTGWKLLEVKDLSDIGMKDREIFFLQNK